MHSVTKHRIRRLNKMKIDNATSQNKLVPKQANGRETWRPYRVNRIQAVLARAVRVQAVVKMAKAIRAKKAMTARWTAAVVGVALYYPPGNS